MPLTKNILKPLAKSVLISVGLTETTSTTDPAMHKKMFRSGMRTLITSNEEMNDIMKILKSPEESGLFIKGVSETIKNDTKEQKGRISQYVIRYIRCQFIRKSVNR